MVSGTYLLLAFNRFGWPDFAWRATVRFLLIGFYGWLGLAAMTFVLGRVVSERSGSFPTLFRLVTHAHLPLLLVGVVIQVAAVSLDVTGIARWPALFAGLFWMPAMLTTALCAWGEMQRRSAVVVAGVSYLGWAALVGRHLWFQLEHLL